MSPAWVKLVVLLCLSGTALGGSAGKSQVLWKSTGESITIQCRCADNPDMLYVKTGLNKDVDVFFKGKGGKKTTITKRLEQRLQINGNVPNVSILIKELTPEDTGPYWCIYKNYDEKTTDLDAKSTGSVLLVVKDGVSGDNTARSDSSSQKCDLPQVNLVMVSVVISTAVLLCIIMGILLWLIKTKTSNTRVKPRHVPNNDVYEDMRGTFRR